MIIGNFIVHHDLYSMLYLMMKVMLIKNKTDALRLLLNPTLEPIFSFMVMITSPQNKNSLLPTLHCPPKPKVGGIMENILHNSSKSMIVKDILQSESLQNDCKY